MEKPEQFEPFLNAAFLLWRADNPEPDDDVQSIALAQTQACAYAFLAAAEELRGIRLLLTPEQKGPDA